MSNAKAPFRHAVIVPLRACSVDGAEVFGVSDGEEVEVPALHRPRQHLRLDEGVLGQDSLPVGVEPGQRVRLRGGKVVPGAWTFLHLLFNP